MDRKRLRKLQNISRTSKGVAYKQMFSSAYSTPALTFQSEDFSLIKKTFELLKHYCADTYTDEEPETLTHFLFLQIISVLKDQEKSLSNGITRPEELYRQFRKLLALHYKEGHSVSYYATRLLVSEVYLSRTVKQVSGNTVHFLSQKFSCLKPSDS